jgi:hypothetical protein
MKLFYLALAASLTTGLLAAADPVSKTFDQQVSMVEKEVVSLAEAMPEDKYGFVPSGAEFSKSRTFAQQVTHIASVNYASAASVLGEKAPVEMGASENGPASLKSKADIVKFLKDSFTYAHKATATVTMQNLNEMVTSAFGNNKVPRLSMLTVPVWHTFDHYGQMVIYARMNGIVPPASR